MLNRFLDDLKLLKRMDWLMALASGLLLVVGVLFVYSSCYVSEMQPVRTLYKRQLIWVLVGMGCYVACAVTDFRRLRRFSDWFYVTTLLLLVLVLFIGTRIYGARRWLMLLGMGIQPSELAKLAVIIVLSRRLSRPGVDFGDPRALGWLLLLVALPVGLIVKQPDLGTAMVFVPTAFVLMFVGGVPGRVLQVLLIAGLLVVGLLLAALYLPEALGASEAVQDRIAGLTGLSEYQRERIAVFFQADRDPLGAGWNKLQSEIAVGSGGMWGKGFLNGTQNILGFLPRSVAPTDFIYSVIAEEKGFVGSMTVLGLFSLVIGLGIRTALGTRDRMGRLLCTGVVSMLFFHVFINIAMTVGLMPITGLPLPLLSYGGSFMVVVMSSLGIVQSVHIRSHSREPMARQLTLGIPVR